MTSNRPRGSEPPDPEDEIAAYVAKLFNLYKNRVASIIKADTGLDGPSLEDLVSWVFSRVQTSLRNNGEIRYEKGYIDQAARSVVCDYFRRKHLIPDPIGDPDDADAFRLRRSSFEEDPHMSVEQKELFDEIQRALNEMEAHFNERQDGLGTLMRIMVVTLHYHLDPCANTDFARRHKQDHERALKIPDLAVEYDLDLTTARRHYYAATRWLKRRLANGAQGREL